MASSAATLATRVRRYCKRERISLRRFGALAGISHTAVADLASRRRTPRLDTLDKVAALLGVEPWQAIKPQ